jgi:hypothetical protein
LSLLGENPSFKKMKHHTQRNSNNYESGVEILKGEIRVPGVDGRGYGNRKDHKKQLGLWGSQQSANHLLWLLPESDTGGNPQPTGKMASERALHRSRWLNNRYLSPLQESYGVDREAEGCAPAIHNEYVYPLV